MISALHKYGNNLTLVHQKKYRETDYLYLQIYSDIMTHQIPSYSKLESDLDLNYLSELSQNRSYNFKYIREDKIAVLRNYDNDGGLVPINQKRSDRDPWVLLIIKKFQDNNESIFLPVCKQCDKDVLNIEGTVNDVRDVHSKLCLHSRIVGFLVRDFENPYMTDDWLQLSEDFSETGSKVELIHERSCTTTKSQHLALVFTKNMISLLWTQGRQLTPNCSNCSSKICSCIRLFNKKCESDGNAFGKATFEVDDESPDNITHYQTASNIYGHNKSKITLPLINCSDQFKVLEARDERFSLPAELIPEEIESLLCKHGKQFSGGVLKLLKKHIIVYHDSGEIIIPCDVYCREISSCRCSQQCDLHPYLLYHLGHGVTVDYVCLQKLCLLINKSGTTVMGYYNHVRDSAKAVNKIYTCQYSQFLAAYNGFVRNIHWDKQVFSCPNCGISPKYFVGDGKSVAPTQRALKRDGVKEISKHKDDNIVLKQATTHDQRTFLFDKQDRDHVSSLLHGSLSIKEFLKYKGKSENFKILHNIVHTFKNEDALPDCYVDFFAEVSKNTPVSGYIQINEKNTLQLLRRFCLREVNLRDGLHQSDLYKLMSELPALWGNILEILIHEDSTFLPKSVSIAILKLIKIRIETFKNAEPRYQDEYFKWTSNTDDQCSFFPNFPLQTHPKIYSVSSKIDKDACEKNFSSHTAFADGIFSIGKLFEAVNSPLIIINLNRLQL